MSAYTSAEEFEKIYSTLFETFKTGKTKDLRWRKWQLKQLWWMLEDNEKRILAALEKDLGRHTFESYFADIVGCKSDVLEHIKHLEEWAADEPISGAGFIFGTLGKAKIRKEPLGVALIIGAWNFPFLLLIQPVIAAVTAGCCVLMKPSELSMASQELLVELVPKYLDTSAINIVTGGPQETGAILEHKFNHIFFTGSSKIARHITAAAAKHLTPTVLELGGQGPAIVTKTANVDLAAKRIAYAKFFNAGQICLSVNHVFADPAIYDELVQKLQFWNKKFSGESGEMSKIVNERNFDRLTGLLKRTTGDIKVGGQSDKEKLRLAPTIVANVTLNDALMEEELFGPVCPVISANYVQAYQAINNLPHPLAIYIFSSKQSEIDEILNNTISGGVTVNDVIMHAGVPTAPFGGVGESGYGYYHGPHGFRAFSHTRVIVSPPTWLDALLAFRYPPFDVAHVPKVAVKNTLGFKRGERLQDQKIKLKGVGKVGLLLRVVAVSMALMVLDKQAGGRLGVLDVVGKCIAPVLAKLA